MKIRDIFLRFICVISVLQVPSYSSQQVTYLNNNNRNQAPAPQAYNGNNQFNNNNGNWNNGQPQPFTNNGNRQQNFNNTLMNNRQMYYNNNQINNQLQQQYNPNNQYQINKTQPQIIQGNSNTNLDPNSLVFLSENGHYYSPTQQNTIPLEAILQDTNNPNKTGIWLYVTRFKNLTPETINEINQSSQNIINTVPGQQQNNYTGFTQQQPINNMYNNNGMMYTPNNYIQNNMNTPNNDLSYTYINGTNNTSMYSNTGMTYNPNNNGYYTQNGMNIPNNNGQYNGIINTNNSNNYGWPIQDTYPMTNNDLMPQIIDGNVVSSNHNSVTVLGNNNTPIMLDAVKDNNTGLCSIRMQRSQTQNNNANNINVTQIPQQNYQSNYPTLYDTMRQISSRGPIVQNGNQIQTLNRY